MNERVWSMNKMVVMVVKRSAGGARERQQKVRPGGCLLIPLVVAVVVHVHLHPRCGSAVIAVVL